MLTKARAQVPDSDGKVALLEALVLAEDATVACEEALGWLASCGISRSACLLLSADGARLVTAVGHGGPRPTFDAADDHPLVMMLGAAVPKYLDPKTDERLAVLGRSPFHAVPLRSEGGTDAGLLLAEAPRHPPVDLVWLASLLGPKLASIRERRQARERSLLEDVINAVTDPILLTDTEGRILVANARAEALFASSEGESEGRRRAVALNNMLFSSALSRVAFDDPEPSRRELLLVDPYEGSDLLLELLATVVERPREGTGIVSVLRNVTDLRRATEEIEENYARLRSAEAESRAERDRLNLIIDSVADPVLVTDPAGNIVLMNQHAERLFTVGPWSPDESSRRSVRLNDAVFSSFASNLYAGQQLRWKGELNLMDPAREVQLPMEALSGKVLSESSGAVTGVVTILHDRSEALEKAKLYEQVKQASEELEGRVSAATAELAEQNELLRRQALQLEQAAALKSQFLANVSHELRTPLNAILGYASMLLQGVSGNLHPGQRRNLTRIEANGQHLLALITNLLDLERIESGKMPIQITEFDLARLVSEVMAELEPLVARAGLEAGVEIPPRIPAISSDRHKVKQILVNLVSNAIKFTPQGSVRVQVRHDARHGRVAIDVVDTGIGIATADQERAFEVFQQVDASNTREFGGTGLGLSICRRLAGMLGGHINLQSAPGKGSTFTVTLPRKARPA